VSGTTAKGIIPPVSGKYHRTLKENYFLSLLVRHRNSIEVIATAEKLTGI
jgi:hypothetical protein